MAPVVLSHVRKVFGDGTVAVTDLDLEIGDGEAVALVGPPGSGKSTVLRMMAGLEDATSGTISIGDVVVNGVPAGARDVAMVFHTYALYPHMTVRENLGLPLEMRKRPAAEIAATVERVAGQLGLTEVLARRPGTITGAARQRVAMGRALVRQPAVLLMDDPFANLDQRQRADTSADLRALLRSLGTTVVHATSNPDEAEVMADRVAVLRRGRLEQIATPTGLREWPANAFVAVQAARPALNLLPAVIEREGDAVVACIGAHVIEVHRTCLELHTATGPLVGRSVLLGVAPNDIVLTARDGAESDGRAPGLVGVVEGADVVGLRSQVRVRLDVPAVSVDGGATPGTDGRARVIACVEGGARVETGERVALIVDTRGAQLFDAVTGASLR